MLSFRKSSNANRAEKRPVKMEKRTPQNRSLNSAQPKKLFGIEWTPRIENALLAAKGNESPEDDRPVMWFRVLGQLDGDM